MKNNIGIIGYGNLGRGVALALRHAPDMALAAIFTRRDPGELPSEWGAALCHAAEAEKWRGKIDAMILCGGSATDLPVQTPQYAAMFNVVDSFDTHARIPEHFAAVDKAAKENGHTALISGGWDPGLFSLNRLYANAVLPGGKDYTFWGRGVSQGHSDAIRRINGKNYSDAEILALVEEIHSVIRNNDMGQAFYNWLVDPQDRIKLIDFDNVENNDFAVVDELIFGKDGAESEREGSFRPDINILINGIPLSFLEVKRPNNEGGIQVEFERMLNKRLEKPEFKKFFNMLQVVCFSNNMEYEDVDDAAPCILRTPTATSAVSSGRSAASTAGCKTLFHGALDTRLHRA